VGETTVTWRIPSEIATAIETEAKRRGVETSVVASEVLSAVIPGWIAASIRRQLDLNSDPPTKRQRAVPPETGPQTIGTAGANG
jgi:hypothetical protein